MCFSTNLCSRNGTKAYQSRNINLSENKNICKFNFKGALSCFVHIGVCAGSALGAFLSIENILGGPSTWHLLLALPAVFGLTQIALNSYTPDTPNHYLNKGNKTEAANSIK